jgi:mono/diheme cytochrome c family protein
MGVWIGGLALPAVPMHAQTLAERGKYLVEKVGHCGDCHTPSTGNGKPDATKLLKGAKTAYTNTPDITSSGPLWVSWKEEGFVRFLETGAAPSGQTARHPMPPYKLRPDDAAAIVQYLKTVK